MASRRASVERSFSDASAFLLPPCAAWKNLSGMEASRWRWRCALCARRALSLTGSAGNANRSPLPSPKQRRLACAKARNRQVLQTRNIKRRPPAPNISSHTFFCRDGGPHAPADGVACPGKFLPGLMHRTLRTARPACSAICGHAPFRACRAGANRLRPGSTDSLLAPPCPHARRQSLNARRLTKPETGISASCLTHIALRTARPAICGHAPFRARRAKANRH